MNEYESYHIIEFLRYYEENKIISLKLSSHIIHLLQFLTVYVF